LQKQKAIDKKNKNMKMKKWVIVVTLMIGSVYSVCAATYTSIASGAWNNASIWSPNGVPTETDVVIIKHTINYIGNSYTSWAGTSASITIQNGGRLSINGNTQLTGNGFNVYVQTGGTLAVTGNFTLDNTAEVIMQGGTLTVSAAFSITGGIYSATAGSTTSAASLTTSNSGTTSFNSAGVFNVSGNVTANGLIQLNPGTNATNSTMTIDGSITINANPNAIVGTNVSSCNTTITNYANLVVKTDVILTGSGDITVNQNGRLVVFGNITRTSGGGTLVTVNCGGQAYVNGNINLGTGGGNTVTNNNGLNSPIGSNALPVTGLYVNGTTTAQTTTGNIGNKSSLQSNDNAFYTYIAGLSGSPLPVTLVFFHIKSSTEEAITLAWATASEINFDYFNLQRSTDGKNFTTIAQIKGNGTTKEYHDYSFTDKLPVSGTAYYRLQSVDFDKYTETFSVVSASIETAHDATLYPVPVTDSNLSFHLNFEPKTEILVSVFSMTGVERMRGLIKANETEADLNLSTLEAGVYVVKMSSIDFNKVSRIVVK
jgi:hypothetical protein